jgi:hypothetical protein
MQAHAHRELAAIIHKIDLASAPPVVPGEGERLSVSTSKNTRGI